MLSWGTGDNTAMHDHRRTYIDLYTFNNKYQHYR